MDKIDRLIESRIAEGPADKIKVSVKALLDYDEKEMIDTVSISDKRKGVSLGIKCNSEKNAYALARSIAEFGTNVDLISSYGK